jgi:hypothetical protein
MKRTAKNVNRVVGSNPDLTRFLPLLPNAIEIGREEENKRITKSSEALVIFYGFMNRHLNHFLAGRPQFEALLSEDGYKGRIFAQKWMEGTDRPDLVYANLTDTLSRNGIDKVNIYGVSFGGYYGFQYASFADRVQMPVEKIFLQCSPTGFDTLLPGINKHQIEGSILNRLIEKDNNYIPGSKIDKISDLVRSEHKINILEDLEGYWGNRALAFRFYSMLVSNQLSIPKSLRKIIYAGTNEYDYIVDQVKSFGFLESEVFKNKKDIHQLIYPAEKGSQGHAIASNKLLGVGDRLVKFLNE